MLDRVYRNRPSFDVVHFHIDYLHFPVSARQKLPHLTTLHGRLDLPELSSLYRHFNDMPLVSISDAQRRPIPWANWLATIYHGLPENFYTPRNQPGRYLAFLGRISPEKRVDRAIEVAIRTNTPLRIAAKIDPVDAAYYEQKIKPMLRHPLVDYLGEIGENEKEEFLGEASALLFLIDWPEPFGLAMIEAMACGTPVIAFRNGSVPEIVEDGLNGYVVESVDEAALAVERLTRLSRSACRCSFEQRFTVETMARNYVAQYRELLSDPASRGVISHASR
jgi:glycosyltransferase involved in cell wall biosynthesis